MVVAGAVLEPFALAAPSGRWSETLSPAIASAQILVSVTVCAAVFVNVQVTSSPAARVTALPDAARGVQTSDVCWYPVGPDSARVYWPAATCTLVTAALLPAPETGV